ncbi:hypothetical protein PENSPDRAFT_657815 [Peniophora sp. CONT]|nr:hypothetical protein PENSPDRAFT_657815 [Peniophora sp. CONT]
MDTNAQAAQAFPFPDVSAHIERLDDSIAAGNASDQLQETIESNIAALEAATLRLRASRNSCRPLLRLPTETLGEIIAILASCWPSTNGYTMDDFVGSRKTRTGLELGWILLGHVCRKLRAAVLARSDLWASNICNITRSPEKLGLYYGNSPLHIDLEIYNPHNGSPGLPITYFDFIARHMNLSRVVKLLEFGKWSDGALFANLDPGIFAKLHRAPTVLHHFPARSATTSRSKCASSSTPFRAT